MGAGFETLIDAVVNQLSMHYSTDAPMFMSGEFASLGGGAVTWSNEYDPSQMLGELNFDEQPNEETAASESNLNDPMASHSLSSGAMYR